MDNNHNHVIENEKNKIIALTVAEISDLWTTYHYETSSKCGIEYFLIHTDDEQIRRVLEHAQMLSKNRIEKLIYFFNKEDHLIPQGFTEKDVNLNAPRLFSDKLYLEYIINTTKTEIMAYGLALTNASRSDIIEFFAETSKKSQSLHIQAKELAKEKGIFLRPPLIPKPKQIEFVKKESFIAGWFGEQRPLLCVEITNLVFNAKRNALGQAVITGFSQVAKSKEVRRYFERGRDISGKHLKVFDSILYEEYISEATLLMTTEVTDSTEAPFSDKLMMNFITSLISAGIGNYGIAISTSPRRDIGVQYTRLIAEIVTYCDDGAELLIENGWMEQPPMAANRKDLAK